jgi:Vitamin K-dependent gamma-carboxylase
MMNEALRRAWRNIEPPREPSSDEEVARRLGAVRIFVGALFLVRTTPLLYLVPGLREHHGGPLFGWPDGELRSGIAGITFPIVTIQVLVVLRTIAALLFMIGVRARPAGIAAAVLGYLVWSQEPFSFIFTLHTLFLATGLLALTDAVNARALVSGPLRSPASPASSVALMRAFILSIYAWSAVGKLHGRWLDGTVLRVFCENGYVSGGVAKLLLGSAAAMRASALGTLFIEALLVPLLWLPRTRVAAVAIACMLHGIFEVGMHPDVFGWLMVGLLVLFWPQRSRHSPMTCAQ